MFDDTSVVAVGLADVRREPDAASELVTQALMNVPVIAGETCNDWTHVTLSDYEGWMRSEQLESPIVPSFTQVSNCCRSPLHLVALVSVTHAPLYADATGEETTGEVYLSTALPVLDTSHDERVLVALPGEQEAWLVRSALALRPPELSEGIYARQSVSVVTGYARQFLGVPYLWGGTSWKGIDCSGLVQLCYRMGGYILPRDADQQHDFLTHSVSREGMREGDLVFFGSKAITHVALALNDHEYIHAAGSYNRVVISSFNPRDEHYYPRLDEIVWGIKRVVV
ncbi:MAG TPA: C40 family peptidase [Ktedonobacteraceae bacterium]|nr:C40 family peptidase [Ktedonobacteraceae bacterium]